MAVTITKSPIPLEYFMQFINIDPLLFNGIDITRCAYVEDSFCNFFWDQYNTGRQMYNREQLAESLCSAYDRVANYLGVKPTLQWITDEIVIEPHWFYNTSMPIETMKLRTKWNGVKEFGQRLLKKQETATLTYEAVGDNDFPSYAEFSTIVPENHNVCDVRAYSGEYEIAPIQLLSFNTETRVATFRIASWNLVIPALYLKRTWGATNKTSCQLTNFLVTIDVYYDMVDPCKPTVELIYNDRHKCAGSCKNSIQPACANLIDSCNGYFTVRPQSYNDIGCVVDGGSYCGVPYKLKVHYRAGCHNDCTTTCDSSCHCRQLLDVVSMLAACGLDSYPLCQCECMSANITKWQANTALIPKDGDRWNIAASIRNELVGGFGTKVGEIEALLRLNQIANSEQFCTRE